jgi:glycosyltransferase involved in cell wall biosynthesis
MRILILAPYPPYPPRGGGALRIYHLLRGLAARHDVTLLSFVPNPAAAAALAPLRETVQVVTVVGPLPRSLGRRALTTLISPLPDMALRNESPAFADGLSRLVASEHFDWIQVESIEMAGYGLALQGLGMRLVLDQFNAEYVLQRRAALTDLRRALRLRPQALPGGIYSLVQWRKLAAYERRLLRAYDQVLVVSEEDRRALRRLAPVTDPLVVPNGVDAAAYAGLQRNDDGVETIVFSGTLDFRPNIDAIDWFVQRVLPQLRVRRPAVRFVVVGRAPAPAVRALHDGATVEVVGEVPDVRPYLARAAVYVVPMRIGGGSRLKLLEALAAGCPVVSTTMGAEGIEGLRDDVHLRLADRPEAFAARIAELLADRERAMRLGEVGRAFVAEHYDWSVIVPRLG